MRAWIAVATALSCVVGCGDNGSSSRPTPDSVDSIQDAEDGALEDSDSSTDGSSGGCPVPVISFQVSDLHVGDTVTLDGNKSHSANGEILSFKWVLTTEDGIQMSDIFRPSSESSQVRFDVPEPGKLTISLTIADASAASPCSPATIELNATE